MQREVLFCICGGFLLFLWRDELYTFKVIVSKVVKRIVGLSSL